MSSPRYAIYLAPPPDSALWRFGSRVLGYDAATGHEIEGFAPPGFSADAWRHMAQRPRQYGFHATLKAPFRLASGQSLGQLEAELATFAAGEGAFDLGHLAIEAIGAGEGFAALVPTRSSAELAALEAKVVQAFDSFRAPLTDRERAKRDPSRLTERQLRSLDLWGYPYVGADYRFHMTLSGGTDTAKAVADALAAAMREHGAEPDFRVDSLVLFGQPEEAARFRILGRYPFRAS
ncbi:MAG: DUF1045 domain-containing protein [Beijerinckiaceae bacterium]